MSVKIHAPKRKYYDRQKYRKIKAPLAAISIIFISSSAFATSDTSSSQSTPAPGTTVCDDGDPEIIKLVNEYSSALDAAKAKRDRAAANLKKIQNMNPALDEAIEDLEDASKEAQEEAKRLALEELKRPAPNPTSWKSLLKWTFGKFKSGDETKKQYKKIFTEYNKIKKQIENELGPGTSWEEKIRKAELEAGAAKEDYDNIHSWIDFFIELDESNVGACVTY